MHDVPCRNVFTRLHIRYFCRGFSELQFARRSFCCGFFGRFSLHDVVFVADFLELQFALGQVPVAGGATPASASPNFALWPGARLGPASREPCGRGGRLCEKRGPATPSVRVMFGDQRAAREGWFQWLLGGMDGEGRRKTARERRAGRARPRMHFPFASFLCFLSFFNFFWQIWGEGEGGPY